MIKPFAVALGGLAAVLIAAALATGGDGAAPPEARAAQPEVRLGAPTPRTGSSASLVGPATPRPEKAVADQARRDPPLSLPQLVGQRLIFAYDGSQPPQRLLARVRRGEVAGVILFSRNFRSRRQLRRVTERLQRLASASPVSAPLLVMMDQEGGAVRRIPGAPNLPADEVGRAGSSQIAMDEGRSAAADLRAVGVNVNLAPVVDVARPSSAIGREGRAYGGDWSAVSKLAAAFARGLTEGGVVPTAKHFPGFGAAQVNTDYAPARIDVSRAELRRVDEPPFRAAFAEGVPLVMLSTAVYPALDDEPAALSDDIATGELRRRLGFRGVSISDDLESPALGAYGSPGPIGLNATEAGTDLLIFAKSYGASEEAAQALLEDARGRSLALRGLKRSAGRVIALRTSLAR